MRYRAAVACCLLAVLGLPSTVMAERTTVTIEKAATPADDTRFRERVALMNSRLEDKEIEFSGTDAMAELKVLRAYVGTRADLRPERRDILSMMGRVVVRSGLLSFEDGLEPMAELMTLSDGDNRPLGRRLSDHYTYAELLGGYAAIPGNSASHALAAEYYGKAALLADSYSGYSDDQRAGTRQKQAYELHEAKRYDEALALNRDVLSRGERIFGPSHPNLITVLTNIAQNLHALGRKQEAEPYLIRVQAIADAEDDLETVQDILFQRGVLAYELGDMKNAKVFMQQRIERLRAAADTQYLARAEEDYEELLDRLGER